MDIFPLSLSFFLSFSVRLAIGTWKDDSSSSPSWAQRNIVQKKNAGMTLVGAHKFESNLRPYFNEKVFFFGGGGGGGGGASYKMCVQKSCFIKFWFQLELCMHNKKKRKIHKLQLTS